MSDTQEKPMDVDKAFGYLTSAINRVGTEAQLKIGAHIRAITDGKISSLGVYHATPTITKDAKLETYRLCFNALIKKGGPDYSTLQGQVHKGDAKGEEPKAEAKPPAKKGGRPDPMSHAAAPAASPPPAEPPSRPVAVPTVQPAVEPQTPADPLTLAIARHLAPVIDERINAALNNGGFPADRVKAIVTEMLPKEATLDESVLRKLIREELALVFSKLHEQTKV